MTAIKELILSSDWSTRTEEEIKTSFESLNEKDIAVFEEADAIPVNKLHSDAHVVVVCLEGMGRVTLEGKEYEAHKNDLFICAPNQFIENVMISHEFKFRDLLASPQYFQSVFYFPGKIWTAKYSVQKNPLFHLKERDVQGFLANYEILKYKLSRKDLPHHEQSIKLFLQSMVYEMYDVLAPILQINMDLTGGHTSSEVLFMRFLNLVAEESPRRQSVSFFADKLCITPKYLAAVCKLQAGKTTSEIINKSVMGYVKQMLRTTDKPIKEIANEAGFDNLSFFGKFVKRETGMSPRDLRMKE